MEESIGAFSCGSCACLCCKRVWRSTYDCATATWGSPTVVSSTSSQICDDDSEWARVAGQCYAEKTVYTSPETCSGSPTAPAGPSLSAPSGCCCSDCCSDLATWSSVSVDLNLTGGTTDFDCPSVPTRNYQKNIGSTGSPSCSGDCNYCELFNATYFLSSTCDGSYLCPAAAGTCTLSGTLAEVYALSALCSKCYSASTAFNCCVSSPPFTFNSPMSVEIKIRFSTRKHPSETYCRLVVELFGTVITTGGLGVTCDTGKGFCAVFISDELTSNICCGVHSIPLACKTGFYCEPFPSSISLNIACLDGEGGGA